MIELQTLTMKNFMSYGNNVTVVDLHRPGKTTLIGGENLDDASEGNSANGTGKSTIINAIAYALYDKPVSKIAKIDNLVNNINKRNLEVTIEFTKGGNTYFIKRVRKSKAGAAGNHVHLYINGVDSTPESVDATNLAIERILGVPYELFVRIVVFSANHTPFLDLPAKSQTGPNQTAIIEELFGLTDLSEKAAVLGKMITETERKIDLHKVKIESLEKEHMRHASQLEAARRRVDTWKSQTATSIDTYRKKIARIEGIDFEGERALHSELDRIGGELSDLLSEQKSQEREEKALTKTKTTLEKELEHLRDAQCPYCLQQYSDAASKIAEIESKIVDICMQLKGINDALALLDAKIKEVTADYKRVKESITIEDLDELVQIKNQVDQIQLKIRELEAAVNPYTEPLQELEETTLDPINYDEVNSLSTLMEHQRFLQKLLTKKDSFVRKRLLNKYIPFLNQRLLHYLQILGLPHTVEFTHEMTADISQFGHPLDFGNLSNGQKSRVNLGLSFAFRDVLERLHTRFNLCVLDEVLDVGLDDIGVQAAARLLKRKARDDKLSLYCISHRSEVDGVFEAKMTVQMSKGFSYLVEDT